MSPQRILCCLDCRGSLVELGAAPVVGELQITPGISCAVHPSDARIQAMHAVDASADVLATWGAACAAERRARRHELPRMSDVDAAHVAQMAAGLLSRSFDPIDDQAIAQAVSDARKILSCAKGE